MCKHIDIYYLTKSESAFRALLFAHAQAANQATWETTDAPQPSAAGISPRPTPVVANWTPSGSCGVDYNS